MAIANLRNAGLLEPAPLAACSTKEIETLVRPAGFQTLKAPALLGLAQHVVKSGVLFEAFLARPTPTVRQELLALPRIGFETADSILLYAGGHEVFVVDVYLRRYLTELGFEQLAAKKYDELRIQLEESLASHSEGFAGLLADLQTDTPSHPITWMSRAPRSPLADIYNELHAVLVRDGVERRRGRL